MPVSIDKQPATLPWSATAARDGRNADRACTGNSCTEQDLAAWRDAWVDYAGRLDDLAALAAQNGAGTPDQATVLQAIDAARADAENAKQLDQSSQTNPMFRGAAITMWARAQARARLADIAAAQLLGAYNIDVGIYTPGPAYYGSGAQTSAPRRKKKSSMLPLAIGGAVAIGAAILFFEVSHSMRVVKVVEGFEIRQARKTNRDQYAGLRLYDPQGSPVDPEKIHEDPLNPLVPWAVYATFSNLVDDAKRPRGHIPYGETKSGEAAGFKWVVRKIHQARKGDSYHIRVLQADLNEADRGAVKWRDDLYIENYTDEKTALREAVKRVKNAAKRLARGERWTTNGWQKTLSSARSNLRDLLK